MEDQARYLDAMRRFSGDPRMVAQVFASMVERGVTPQVEHWQYLLDAQLAAGDTDAADDTIKQMIAADIAVNNDQLYDVAVSAVRRGDITRAVAQFDALHQRGARPGAKHAPAVFNAFVAAKRFPAARAVLRDITQRGDAVAKDSFTPLLQDALKRRAVKDAEALVAMMLTSGHTPDDALASEIALMVCHATEPRRACTLVTELLDKNVTFSESVYATILRGLAARKDFEGVEMCVAAQATRRLPVSSFARNADIHAKYQQNRNDDAWQALTELFAHGMLATGENLTTAVSVSVADKQLTRAATALSAMLLTASPVASEQLQAVITLANKDNDPATATALVYDTLAANVALDRRVLRDITQNLLKQHAVRHALVLLGDAKKAGVVSSRAYGSVLIYLLQNKHARHAHKLLDFMVANRIRLNTADASTVLRLTARDGSREDTLALCDAFTAQKVYADEPAYRELLWACARAGDTVATRRVYDTIAKAGIAYEDSHEKALSWATGQTPRRLDGPVDMPQPAETAEAYVAADEPKQAEPVAPAPPEPVKEDERAKDTQPEETATEAGASDLTPPPLTLPPLTKPSDATNA